MFDFFIAQSSQRFEPPQNTGRFNLEIKDALRLEELNMELSKMGFLFDSREPLYKDFLRNWHDLRYADRKPLSPAQALERREAMKALLRKLMPKESAR